MKHRFSTVLLSVLLLSVSPLPAIAQSALVPTISGNELTARIELAGGVSADLTVTFENVVGLNPAALALTATLVNPSDLTLLSRLGSGVSIPTGFPVVVKIEPSASSALSFEGVYNLSIHTNNLTLGANSPLRLYRAPQGANFQDMTGYLQAGSVRAGGSGPGFSEFVIAADTRAVDSVISGKFTTLQGQLSANSSGIAPDVAADLQQRLNQARAAYDSGALSTAIDGIAGFGNEVKKQSGAAIPNVWRANGGPANVAGILRSSADTLKYSLVFKSNLSPLP
jgi:uncharacterized protein DUF6689